MSENKFPMYRGKPLVRSGDTIYYGNMYDSHVVKLDIKSKKIVDGLEIADKVNVQLIATNPTLDPQKMIEKTSEKNGLYLALDIADVWLTRRLLEK